MNSVLGLRFPALANPAALQPPAMPQPAGNPLIDAIGGVIEKVVATAAGPERASPEKSRLLARLAELGDPPNTTPEQSVIFEKVRAIVRKSLAPDAPDATALKEATAALDKLAGVIDSFNRTKAVADLNAKDPDAGKKAQAAFRKFAKVLGDKPVNPETIKKAAADKAARQKEVDAAVEAVKRAQALPEGADKAGAVAKSLETYRAARGAFEKADALEEAMIGQSSLTAALSHGPLSANTDGGFKDPGIGAKLIDAYSRDARMADAAVTAATTAKYPGVVADNVGPMIDRVKGGFADKHGLKQSPAAAELYGQELLKAGGQLGPKYFDGLPDYLSSGQQFRPDAAGTGNARTWNAVAQNRSRTLAGALIKPDGSIDADSEGARNAIGNLLYHPDVLTDPTPGLSENVLRTVDMLHDPVTGPQASAVLKGVTAPKTPAAQRLVGDSLGSDPAAAPEAGGARTAVLTAMLQPFDQASVGSCFVTGPARRQRETQPIEVMKSYAELASTGVYTPRIGDPLPAITNLPADENPLMRSLEYTAATAGARNADSVEHQKLAYAASLGTDLLKPVAMKGAAPATADKDWSVKQQKLVKDVAAAFTFTYDAKAEIPASADGSSSKGRYVIGYKGADITTRADFETAMLEVALASLGVAAGTDKAVEVETIVRSDDFAAAVCPYEDDAPWAIHGGGYAEGSLEALYGTKTTRTDMVKAGDPKVSEGARTTEVLAGLLKTFQGNPAAMVTVDTSGQHSFNALPNDPSLDALKGADEAETGRKIKANLTDKGAAMKDTLLPPDRAAWLFDEAVKKETGQLKDPALQKLVDDGVTRNRPKAAMKPAEVTRAVQTALKAFNDRSAENQTGAWKTKMLNASRTVTPQEEADHLAKLKASYDAYAVTQAKNALMKDLGAPEFVIADSNWGDATHHTFFVIAPDPTNGEPIMWMKTEPPGSLMPAGRDWIDRPWQTFK